MRSASLALAALTSIAFVALGLPDGLLGVAWPSMRHTFALSLDDIGALLAAFATGYVASSFTGGRALASLGLGWLLVLSCLATGVVMATLPLALHRVLARLSVAPVVMRFRSDEVSGSSGCNGFGGTYTVEPGRIVFGPLMGTMMACPQPAMSIEQAVRKALTGAVPYTLAGNNLTFTAGGTTLVFTATVTRPRHVSIAEARRCGDGRNAH